MRLPERASRVTQGEVNAVPFAAELTEVLGFASERLLYKAEKVLF